MRSLTAAALVLTAALATGAVAQVKAGNEAWSRGDFTRAVEEWRGPARAGNADAQFNLGQAYKLGRGVPADPAKAEEWFLRAARQGHQHAGDNYGLALFQAGRKAEAAPWLQRSAERGEPRAQLMLGMMLFNGDGVRRDDARAYAMMTLAVQQGVPSAAAMLARMDPYVSAANRARGVELIKRYTAKAAVPAAPAPQTATKPVAPAAGGAWRIQLGAFRDPANARALWSQIGGRVGGSPSYAVVAGTTRLRAGPFASKAAAEHACAAATKGCVVLAP